MDYGLETVPEEKIELAKLFQDQLYINMVDQEKHWLDVSKSASSFYALCRSAPHDACPHAVALLPLHQSHWTTSRSRQIPSGLFESSAARLSRVQPLVSVLSVSDSQPPARRANSNPYIKGKMSNDLPIEVEVPNLEDAIMTQANSQHQPSNPSMTKGSKATLTNWKFDQEAIRKALSYMLTVDELPFKFVENVGFKHLMKVACPRFRIPSRWTISRDCYDLYMEESHKGEEIGMAIERCLFDWGVDNVFTMTVDNASSNDVAIAYIKRKVSNWRKDICGGKFLHMRCIAHIINLVVQDGLKEMGDSVARVRDVVRYVRHSPARLKNFKRCAKVEKVECKKMLCLDVNTRWNSTYLMLDTAQRYEMAFERFRDEDPSFRIELETRDGIPSSFDWEQVRKFVMFLEHFYELTIRVSSSLCKLGFVQYALSIMYEGDKGLLVGKKVQDTTFELFAEYKKLSQSKNEESNRSETSSSTCSTGQGEAVERKFKVLYQKYKTQIGGEDNKSELDRYLGEDCEKDVEGFDILEWWRLNSQRFPVLSHMVHDVLVVSISTVVSESAFSIGGRVLDAFRSSLTPKIVQDLICTQDWMRGSHTPIKVEEDIYDLENLEKELSKVALESTIGE
ncbi:zinc finger BED domain-containing protein RICESLEEPER 2-like [Malania oleifera]|uniref:zinc finger BED domain-containing protein RICESLEEPER 2-like n=1 Tax=Malania oleifera TaxID=397392 RepID=UPI0025AE9583|nr:zinc finger BED domain-containing protein RICESLEEPER 2-like [Malania oleifera]